MMRLFAVAPTVPFFAVFIEALREGRFGPHLVLGRDPLANAEITLLMPSRRAARSAEAAVLEALGGRAAILPRIKALPDVDEAELFLSDVGADAYEALPPALSPLERTFALMGFVRALADRLATDEDDSPTLRALPAEAAHLAAALGRLFDAAAVEECDFARLDRLVPDEFDRHWQASAMFLDAVRTLWPAELAARGALDFGERRRRLIEAETARIASGGGGAIVAVAPPAATSQIARLLAAIARRADGAVVLPGLDLALDERSWNGILADAGGAPAPTHAQYGFARLLKRLGVRRSDIAPLAPSQGAAARAVRGDILGQALLPAAVTDLWGGLSGRRDGAAWEEALAGVSVVEARSEGEEALAIALVLREAAAVPGKTAALVTPDRVIARRVAAELNRFGLSIDDSAGVPLGRTPPAVFARLLAEAVAEGLPPVGLLALLKHPFATFGFDRAATRSAARALERLILRGPRPGRGLAGLREAFAKLPAELAEERKETSPEDLAAVGRLIDALGDALTPLEEIARDGPAPVGQILEAHRAALERATAGSGAELFAGENGEALAAFLADLGAADHGRLTLALADYPALFGALMADRVVRPRAPSHPRLHIWGLREARLQTVDRIVLAGLNEGVWPPQAEDDPWVNRPMRAAIGLSQPEEAAGLAACDFACAFACDEVFLVRSLRAGGAPTVPSRLLARLEAVIGPEQAGALKARGRSWLDWAALADRPEAVRPIARPCPKPPVAARPKRLSVTEIEIWLRDPYSIYARHVLKLRPLDPLDDLPTAERGTAVHDVIARFVASPYAGREDEKAVAAFLAIGRERLAALLSHPPLAAFWQPRFEAIARWFVAFEAARRRSAVEVLPETSGKLPIRGPAFVFELVGRADRIERRADGGLAVLDYKTGSIPTAKEIKAGFSPQLPLLGAMAEAGAFARAHRGRRVLELAHVKLGGGDPPGETRSVAEAGEAIHAALAGLTRLATRFQEPGVGYLSMPHPRFRLRYGDYDHLARVREWALVEEGEA